jgi:phage shock protein C
MTSALPPTPPPPMNPPIGEQPSPPPGPSARPQLLRSGTDYSGIDSLLWRVGFVGLTVAGGAGIVIYLLLWVLMPSAPLPADTWPSPVERVVERLHRAVSGALASTRRD